MKQLRHLCAAAVLACVMTQAVWADDGTIHGGITPPPPPPPPPPAAYGIDPEDTLANGRALPEPVTEIVINLVQSMISFF